MSEVTGPISTLPGRFHDVPDGQKCDEHPDRDAVARVQGETDSFGAELFDMCEDCLDEHRKYMAGADHSGTCDWCKQHKPRLRPQRDFEEGMSGRVYDVCDDCVRKANEEAERELSSYWGDDGWDD